MGKLGFGMMRLPIVGGTDSVDVETVKAMSDEFLKQGFVYYDTAYGYHNGTSETVFRDVVARRYPRGSFAICTKMPIFSVQSEEQLSEFFNEQLEKCGVEYFDNYMLHCINRMFYQTAQNVNAFPFLAQKKKEGKINNIGFSYHDNAELLEQILTEHPEVDVVQLQFNYVDIDDIGIESGKCYEIATKHGKKVIVMEPLKGGVLASVPPEAAALFAGYDPDASPASWALRYAASFENVEIVLSGMNSMGQLTENITTMKDPAALNTEEQTIIKKAAEIIKASISIPCTECRYCVSDCPQNIAIPEYFTIYNNLRRFEATQKPIAANYYSNLSQVRGKASECIECGVCEERCTQRLPIREHLKEVAAAFE